MLCNTYNDQITYVGSACTDNLQNVVTDMLRFLIINILMVNVMNAGQCHFDIRLATDVSCSHL